MTHLSLRAALRVAALSCVAAVFATGCSGGGGSAFPSQAPISTSNNPTSTDPTGTNPTSNVPTSASPGDAPPSVGGVPIASPPGLQSISQTSVQLDAAHVAPLSAGGTLAYSDTFESVAVGRWPSGWSGGGGTWSVCQPPSRSHEVCAGFTYGSEAFVGNSAWSNYHVDALAAEADLGQGGIAVLGRVQDASHFYQLELRKDFSGSSRTMWYILRDDANSWTEIAGGPFSTTSLPYYRLRLAFHGDVISAFVAYNYTSNFQALGSGTDSRYTAGNIGLRSWGTSTARFDDVAVTTELAANPAPAPTPTPHPGPTQPPRPGPTQPPRPGPTSTPRPAPIPTAAPTIAPSRPGNVATYAGCNMFTPGDWYNNDISQAPVAGNSSSQISATNSASRGQQMVFSIGIERLNLAKNSTPTHSAVAPPGSSNGYYHSSEFAGVPWPWQSGYYIEGAPSSGGGGGSDNHGLVLNTDNCHLYETYWTWWNGGTFGAYSGGHWDLSRPFVGFAPSGMASGLSLFTGAIKWEYDLADGSINHALNFYVPEYSQGPGVSLPAVSNGSQGPRGIDYGAHLRLHASFPESGTSQMVAVIRALKKYGMYLADTSSPGGEVGFYTITPLDGNNGHYNFGGRSSFTLNDFDVIPPSAK